MDGLVVEFGPQVELVSLRLAWRLVAAEDVLGKVGGDGQQVNQPLLGQLMEQTLACRSTTGVTVVIDFLRLIQLSGATAKVMSVVGTTSRVEQVRGANPRINQREATIA